MKKNPKKKSEAGASFAEYALLVAFICIAAVSAQEAVGISIMCRTGEASIRLAGGGSLSTMQPVGTRVNSDPGLDQDLIPQSGNRCSPALPPVPTPVPKKRTRR